MPHTLKGPGERPGEGLPNQTLVPAHQPPCLHAPSCAAQGCAPGSITVPSLPAHGMRGQAEARKGRASCMRVLLPRGRKDGSTVATFHADSGCKVPLPPVGWRTWQVAGSCAREHPPNKGTRRGTPPHLPKQHSSPSADLPCWPRQIERLPIPVLACLCLEAEIPAILETGTRKTQL